MTSILAKLEKLKARSADTSSPVEAGIALQMLQDLLAEHNLTEKDLDRYKLGEIKIKSTQSVSQIKDWENMIMWTVAQAFGGHVLWTNGHSWIKYRDGSKVRNSDPFGHFTLIGFKQTLPLMEYAATFLLRAVINGRREMNARLPAHWDRRHKTYELDGYCQGFVTTVRKKITALSVDPLILEYVEDITVGRPARDAQIRDGGMHGMLQGAKDGEAIDLHRPLSKEEQLRLGQR